MWLYGHSWMQRNFRAPAGTFETRKQQGVAREDANNVMAVLELVFASLYYSFLWGPDTISFFK